MQMRKVEITAHLTKGCFGSMERKEVIFEVETENYGPIQPLYPEFIGNQTHKNEDVKKEIADGWRIEKSAGAWI